MAHPEDLEAARSYYARILPFYEREAESPARRAVWTAIARRYEPRRILELGTGPGWIAAALSRTAFTVGTDISFEMLSQAKRRFRARPRLHFVAADLIEAVSRGRFDLIVAPSDPFCHLARLADRRRALEGVAAQLAPGGRFVLEGLVRRRKLEYPERRIRLAGGALAVAEDWSPLDARRGLWRGTYRYRELRSGRSGRSLEASFVARAWEPGRIRALFSSCGLAVETISGDFDGRPFRADSRKLVVMARRRARFLHPRRRRERKKTK